MAHVPEGFTTEAWLDSLLLQMRRELVEAGACRENHNLRMAWLHFREVAHLLGEINELLMEINDDVRDYYVRELREAEAAEALLEANLYAPERSLNTNRARYSWALSRTIGLPDDYEGRVRSSLGAVLMFYGQWGEAIVELETARTQLRASDGIDQWIKACCRLATAFEHCGRRTEAIKVLRQVTATMSESLYQPVHGLSEHHLSAAILLVHLLVRSGKRKQAAVLIHKVLGRAKTSSALVSSSQYATLKRFTHPGGYTWYALTAKLRRRTLEV